MRKKPLVVLLPVALILAWGCSRDDSPVVPAAAPPAVHGDSLNPKQAPSSFEAFPADSAGSDSTTRILRISWGKVKDKYADGGN